MSECGRVFTVVTAVTVLAAAMLIVAPLQAAEQSNEELAKKIQNPIADLISVPFQNNINFGYGPDKDTQNVLNIQPVIPISLSRDYNLITRTIFPVINQPPLGPGLGWEFGLGDIEMSLFVANAEMIHVGESGKFMWGVGPIFQFPSATDRVLGQGKWCAGPTAVGVYMEKHWVVGLLANNIWSFAGQSGREDVNQMLVQPFVNYNLPGAWYFTFSPIITANWKAPSDNAWTVPLGLGVGKVFRLGKLPLNTQVSGYYNVVKPDLGPDWQLRLQIAILLPK